MNITPYHRKELLRQAMEYTGTAPVHQTGPAKGKPLGKKRLNRALTRFIKDMKSQGRLIERRSVMPEKPGARVARFIFVPQTLDMFAVQAQRDRQSDQPHGPNQHRRPQPISIRMQG